MTTHTPWRTRVGDALVFLTVSLALYGALYVVPYILVGTARLFIQDW
jgi:hypothetical protein